MIDIFGDGRHITVNTLGHAVGVLIFGFFLALMFSQRTFEQLRPCRLSLLAAAMAFLWNLVSLAVLLMGPSTSPKEQIAVGIGFCVLSVLPAVLLDLCLAGRFPTVVKAGYILSACAVLAHIIEFFHDAANLHHLGLTAITIGFGFLSVISVLLVIWSGGDNQRSISMRILSTMSLFLLAISFAHFSDGESSGAWASELAVHHAGIPLGLFVLMQDYRFVFLDAFVRVLVNGLLALIFALIITNYSSHFSFAVQVLAAAVILASFAVMRGFLQRLLTRLVFRQPDTETTIRELRVLGSRALNEAEYLQGVGQCVARFMDAEGKDVRRIGTRTFAGLSSPVLTSTSPEFGELLSEGVDVVVPIGHSQLEKRYILLGARRGGRRYLSEDLSALARIGTCVSEQIDHLRELETRRLISEAELRALQAQIHPHFLFNAFNTLYGIIPRHVSSARQMLLNLADIFRYFLQSNKTFVPVEEELRIVRAYLAIEKLRLGDKLRVKMDVDDAALRDLVPVLSIQPLVENAVKHGVAVRPDGGAIGISVKHEDGVLSVQVRDTGPGFDSGGAESGDHAGVGLDNVSKRLVLCYGPAARIKIESTAQGATVSFVIPRESARSLQKVSLSCNSM